MAVRLFVGNLPYNTTEEALREYMSSVGTLSYVYLPLDRESNRPRGFAFVEFSERAQAEEAIRRFNNQLFMGRPLAVNEARERDERSRPTPAIRDSAPPGRAAETSGASERSGKSFGPDAAPRKARKPGRYRDSRSERAPKQPIRERGGGRFFADVDDESADDDLSSENFASRLSNSNGE